MKFCARIAAGISLAVGLLWISTTPALAHTGFEASEPADGTTIDQPLGRLTLRFSGPAEPAGEGFAVLDPSGVIRQPTTVTADQENTVWTLTFDPPLAGGVVGVRWTVQAPDAHPINGTYSFTVTAPPATDPAPDAGESSEATVTVTGEGTETELTPPVEPTESFDSFMTPVENGAPYAGLLGVTGRVLGLAAAMASIGGMVFAAHVLRGRLRDAYLVVRWVRHGAGLVLVGAVIEMLAQVGSTSPDWVGVASLVSLQATAFSSFGAAVGLRALSGLVLFSGAKAAALDIRHQALNPPQAQPAPALVGAGVGHAGHPPWMQPPPLRAEPSHPYADPYATPSLFEPRPIDPLGVPPLGYEPESEPKVPTPISLTPALAISGLALLISFVFDGHTTTEGNRWITGLADVVHVAAGAVWAGGVLAMALVLWDRHRRNVQLGALELGVRFSVVASVALIVAGLAGTMLAVIILDSPSSLVSTSWGQLLILKFFAVAAAAAIGGYNHFSVIPWLNSDPDDDTRSVWLRNVVTGEAVILIVVITLTALLVGAAS